MMKSFVFTLVLGSLGFAHAAPARTSAPTRTTATTTNSAMTVERSQKKIDADRGGLPGPQVLETGDNLVGIRVNQGGIYNDSSVAGLSYEHMVRPNFGLGVQARYSSYTNRFAAGDVTGQFDYTATTLVGLGNLHADVFKVHNLDTFVTAGLGHTFLTSRWSSNAGFDAPTAIDTSSTFLVAYLNARYFVDSRWSFTASLGTGLGTLGLGMDYLF